MAHRYRTNLIYEGGTIMTATTLPVVSRKRRVAFHIVVGVISLLLIAFTGVLAPILPGVIIGWFDPEIFGIHQLHEMNSGALSWLILAGMLLLLHKPERKVAALQMANLVFIVSIVVSLVAGTFFPPILLFLVLTAAAAWLHPKRQEMLRFGRPGHPELLALVALAAVPLIIFAVNQIDLQRLGAAGDPHAEFGHYGAMANVAVTLLFVGLLASFKTAGWRIPAWGASFVAVVFGRTSVVFPEQASSVGLLWGSLAIVWGLLFIGVAEWKRLKEPET
jgi:hypothetical protein